MINYDDAPEQRQLLWKSFYWFAGVACLFVWNSILSLNQYWNAKFKDGIQNTYPFFYMQGSFASFFLLEKVNKWLTFKIQVSQFPSIMAITFYIDLMVGEFIDREQYPTLKLIIFLIVIFIQGFVNNLLQTVMTRYVLNFSPKDITNFTTGTALAGVGSGLTSFCLTYTPLDVTNQFIVYLSLVTIQLIIMSIIFYAYVDRYGKEDNFRQDLKMAVTHGKEKNKMMDLKQNQMKRSHKSSENSKNFFSKKTAKRNRDDPMLSDIQIGELNESLIDSTMRGSSLNKRQSDVVSRMSKSSLSQKVQDVIVNNHKKESWKDRQDVFKRIYTIPQLLACNYAVTLGSFPALCFILGVGIEPVHGIPLVVLIYNLGDMMGKYSYKWMPQQDGNWLYFYGVARSVFFCTMFAQAVKQNTHVFFGNVFFSIILQFSMAFTNGHFTTTCFASAPTRVNEDNKKVTGFIMVMALQFGLTYGGQVTMQTS